MSTIRETVQQTMQQRGQEQYMSYAEPVIQVLEQREQRAINTLVSLATQRGISQQECQQALRQSGLDQSQGAWSTQGTGMQTPSDQGFGQGQQGFGQGQQYGASQTGDVAQQISDLQNQVRTLQEVARRAGMQV